MHANAIQKSPPVEILVDAFSKFSHDLRQEQSAPPENFDLSEFERAICKLRFELLFPPDSENGLQETLQPHLDRIFQKGVLTNNPTFKNCSPDFVYSVSNKTRVLFQVKRTRAANSDYLLQAASCVTKMPAKKPCFIVTFCGPLITIAGAAWWKPTEATNGCLCVDVLFSIDLAFSDQDRLRFEHYRNALLSLVVHSNSKWSYSTRPIATGLKEVTSHLYYPMVLDGVRLATGQILKWLSLARQNRWTRKRKKRYMILEFNTILNSLTGALGCRQVCHEVWRECAQGVCKIEDCTKIPPLRNDRKLEGDLHGGPEAAEIPAIGPKPTLYRVEGESRILETPQNHRQSNASSEDRTWRHPTSEYHVEKGKGKTANKNRGL